MIDTPEFLDTDARDAAVIRLTIPRSEIQSMMGPAIGEVMAAVSAQGLHPAGPLFSHHFRRDPDTFDFEVGVPLEGSFSPTGRVSSGRLPAARVARTVHRGGYEGLGDAWCEFGNWLAEAGHEPADEFWECYVSGPESSPDPANWRTELNCPLRDHRDA